MRLLLFADLHLDTPFTWAGRDVANARRRALHETLRRLCTLAEQQEVDAVLCAGDLYEHERFTPDTRRFVRDMFARLHPLPVFLAPGNHDWYGEESLYRQADWTDNVHIFTDAHLTPVELAPGCTLWGAAHRAPANTDGFLDGGFHVDRGGVNLALFHGSEISELSWQEDGKTPHAPFRANQIPVAGLDHAFCGHFHTPKDAPWHTYPGNPDPLAFGETGDRGAVVAEVAGDGGVSRTRHDVGVSEVHDCMVDLTGVTHSGGVRERVAAELKGLEGVVRLTLAGEIEPDVDVRVSDLNSGWDTVQGVVVRLGDLRVAHDLDALRAEKSVRGEFVRRVQDDPSLDDEIRWRVLHTGLRALTGRCDDLEAV